MKKTNEATFEARLNGEIKRLFPQLNELDITHQQNFKLNLGNNTYSCNGTKKIKANARSDILIKYKETNLAILELKAPGIALTDDDTIQGTSYARLLNPMPPITIVSNGGDTKFFTTYDRKPWVTKDINEQAVQVLFKSGMECAATDRNKAIEILLGNDDDMWREMILRYTQESLKEIKGDIGDFSCQIAPDFQIQRAVVNKLINEVQDKPLINFIGPLLSGKTNAVFQLCNKCPDNISPIYIDANFCYDPFEKLANWFCREVFRNFTSDNVKNWLINGFRDEKKRQNRILFIFDNIQSADDKRFWEPIHQLFDINSGNKFTILLVMNEYVFNIIGQNNIGPAKNAIGKAPILRLSMLTYDEFNNATNFFKKNYNVIFLHGSQYNLLYRNPSALRMIASNLSVPCMDKDKTIYYKTFVTLPSCLNYYLLELIWEKILVNQELRSDYRLYVEAMLDDRDSRIADPQLGILSVTRGVISLKTAEQKLNTDRINRMKKNGNIRQLCSSNGKTYFYPCFPEAVAIAAASVLSEKINEIIKKSNVEKAYHYLMDNIDCIPHSDVVAARVILNICEDNDVISELINMLANDPPLITQNDGYKSVGMYFVDTGHIKVSGKLEGAFTSNYNPWLILSNLLVTLSIEAESGSKKLRLDLFEFLGSFNNLLIKPENWPFKNMSPFHVHEIYDGEFVCGETGIVEQITSAMIFSFLNMPEEMLNLAEEAIANNNFFLVMRLVHAAKEMCGAVEPLVSKCACKANKLLNEYIKKRLNEFRSM